MNDELNKILENLKKCEICKEKFGFQPHPVFWGNANSKAVQISQAPSATVHETLKPFTDKTGKKLKYEWYMIDDEVFYNPNNFYIASPLHIVTLEKIKMVMIGHRLKYVMKNG